MFSLGCFQEVFDAELLAIKLALDDPLLETHSCVSIFCDSQAAIMRTNNRISTAGQSTTAEIWERCKSLKQLGININIEWVPGHS